MLIGMASRKGYPALALLTLLLLGVTACRGGVPMRGILKLGLVAPFSGRDYAQGYSILYAVKLALYQANERGGVAGYRVELVAQDDRNEADMGLLQARKMAIDPDVIAVLGHLTSPSAEAAAWEYHRAGLPMITLGATSNSLTSRGYPEILRLHANDALIAQKAARFASQLKAKRVAIISEPLEELVILGRDFRRAAQREGIDPVLEETLRPETSDYDGLSLSLQAQNPDLLFFSGRAVVAGELWAQASPATPRLRFLGGPLTASADLLKTGGERTRGVYYLSLAPAPKDLPEAAEFVRRYREFTGTEPSPSALLAYDATNLLLSAAEDAATGGKRPQRLALRDALHRKAYEGLTGRIAFDTRGERLETQVYIYQITNMSLPGELQR